MLIAPFSLEENNYSLMRGEGSENLLQGMENCPGLLQEHYVNCINEGPSDAHARSLSSFRITVPTWRPGGSAEGTKPKAIIMVEISRTKLLNKPEEFAHLRCSTSDTEH